MTKYQSTRRLEALEQRAIASKSQYDAGNWLTRRRQTDPEYLVIAAKLTALTGLEPDDFWHVVASDQIKRLPNYTSILEIYLSQHSLITSWLFEPNGEPRIANA